MLKLIGSVAATHDLRLVALSALICALGCVTTTNLLARADDTTRRRSRRWLAAAAVVFGCSVWSLHFVAMLAFVPARGVSYDVNWTAGSVAMSSGGAWLALLAARAQVARAVRVIGGGVLLGLSVAGMHYLGVAAMGSGLPPLDRTLVAWSLAICIGLATLAVARADRIAPLARRFEVAGWLSLAICELHFTGMAAMTMTPAMGMAAAGGVPGSAMLAVTVGGMTVAILIAGLAAIMVEHHLARRSLQELSRMRLMSNLAQEVLFIHQDGVVLEVNSAGERLFKAGAADIIGRQVLELFSADDAAALVRRGRCPPVGRPPEEVEFQAIDGTRTPVELSCQPIDYLGRTATAVALRDLTARRQDEARILHLARHDTLTNLPNRHSLMERLDMALDTAAQQRGALAVLYIDLDRFKAVNDLHGHATGDALLVQATRRMAGELHGADMLARIGGDEFILVVVADARPELVSLLATRIIEALCRPFVVEGHRVEIGASIGIALYPDDGASADTLMRAADVAMYRVKEEGRGALRFYEASMNAQAQARLLLEQELAGALDRDELVLHYQPIVNAATGVVETFEALIRWEHPRRGLVPPLEFIPLAEQTGLIDGIGRWVIATACREAAGWARPWRVSVNVSPRQFHQSDVCAAIAQALRANGLAASRLVVEVTESILIDDAARAVATLNQLRDMGVRIALDDFGTGYSSLSYLQLFKFDKFKIDKSFVRRLGQNEDALTLTRTIVNLGHNLGLQVTAEGVETPAQLAILQELGCDQVQGYLLARPAPMAALTGLDRLAASGMFGRERAAVAAREVAAGRLQLARSG